jgi:protocatechuate 3,4-dioxygenase beta subunit
MNRHPKAAHRRQFLTATGFGAAAFFTTPGLFAEELAQTAAMTEGPFYPDRMPLDTDNDLLVLSDSLTPAIGEITYLTGRVLGKSGLPIRNALVEIWQVDHKGAYIHSGSINSANRDTNFQGYGRFLTDSEGRYFFRTVKPVRYPGRAPHIHFAISLGGKRVLTTQLLITGEPLNEEDGLLRRLGPDDVKKTVLTEFKPLAESKIGELNAHWDIVLGITASDADV